MQTSKSWRASLARLRIYAAGAVVLITHIMLRLAQRFYRARLLGLAGIENVIHLSRKLRRFGRRLLKSKHSSH